MNVKNNKCKKKGKILINSQSAINQVIVFYTLS